VGNLESRVHRQSFHEVSPRAIEDEIVQMRCCVTLSETARTDLQSTKSSLLTSFCKFSTLPGFGIPSAARQLENR
jgi:hypothetical protein